jgi:TIGR03009 family protein
MNRRRLLRLVLTAVLLTSLFGIQPVPTSAQQASPRGTTRQNRPVARQMRVEKLSPELLKVLKDWEIASGKFDRLQGDYYRWTYEFVFNVEKRAYGKFWFEAPDKGRIDMNPWKSTEKPRTLGIDGKPLQGGKPFKVQPGKEEQWISNGTQIIWVDTDKKAIDIYPIPKELQGKGITDSPLPFLFGIKADKAQRRFSLSAGKHHNPKQGVIHLIAYPRLLGDARNWSRAEVMLDAKTFYPQAIKLIDPGGGKETVYKFYNVHEPNLFAKLQNPFKASRLGFRRIDHGMSMPRLIGLHWKKTKERLEKAGYQVKLKQGAPAPNSKLVYRIYRQSPLPQAPLKKEVPIVLTLYGKMAGAKSGATNRRTGATNRTSAKPARGAR